jgi:hypothetical protein
MDLGLVLGLMVHDSNVLLEYIMIAFGYLFLLCRDSFLETLYEIGKLEDFPDHLLDILGCGTSFRVFRE